MSFYPAPLRGTGHPRSFAKSEGAQNSPLIVLKDGGRSSRRASRGKHAEIFLAFLPTFLV